MKNIKLHAIILALIIVSELIGTHTLKFGIGRIVLLPMLYALLLGILTTPKFLNLSGKKEMLDASSLVGVTLMLLMAVYVFAFPKYRTENVCITLLGLVYVAMLLSYIYKVRTYHDGIYTVWLIFAASWVNDTFAYFTGVFFGRHKMAPKLSPKKSVEGGIGGVVASAVIGGIYGFLVSPHMSGVIAYPVVTFAAASFIGAFFAIVGDLAASAIKRNHDVKDYGTLIPGHGGILDRFDSVIFTAPAVYWAVYLINQFL